jgi:hypothetical protein
MLKELHELAADLQPAEITVQVEAVQALKVQLHVPVQHIVHRDRHRPVDPRRHDTPPARGLRTEDALTRTEPHAEPATSAVSGGACLDE